MASNAPAMGVLESGRDLRATSRLGGERKRKKDRDEDSPKAWDRAGLGHESLRLQSRRSPTILTHWREQSTAQTLLMQLVASNGHNRTTVTRAAITGQKSRLQATIRSGLTCYCLYPILNIGGKHAHH
ncbi:hypothetical protein CDL15_Pgr019875 [Punica granatum]|uniref:Uncharacterized protein n=1 Tax=Punica granatum TaxID=22663 RepID=A0A218W3R5_PUNGR|nr:hypothetical protein CDL15_Pgr019875 [Punica granatum]PKI74185.1 hypothetical protein CRG98_005423 [Punica granatum]